VQTLPSTAATSYQKTEVSVFEFTTHLTSPRATGGVGTENILNKLFTERTRLRYLLTYYQLVCSINSEDSPRILERTLDSLKLLSSMH